MDSVVRSLSLQYEKCLKMLHETITRYDDRLWFEAEAFQSPAWQIIYHALHYTNIYCSPTEARIRMWAKTRPNLHRFAETSSSLPREEILANFYTKEDMLEFLSFVQGNIPLYLAELQPEDRCWPPWYDETQLEFHLNNLRHIQHHIGQANERQNNLQRFDYQWYGE